MVLTLIGFLILGGFEAWRDSATFDEPVYVSSGVAAILHHDVADNAEHPPLFKVLAALPVLAVGPVVPADGHWNVNNERTYSARFVQAQIQAGTLRRVTFASRLVPLLECGLACPRPLRIGLPPLRCVVGRGGRVAVASQPLGPRSGTPRRRRSAVCADDRARLVGVGALVATA